MLLDQGNIWRGEDGWNWKLDIHPDSFEIVVAHVQQSSSCRTSSARLTPPDNFSVDLEFLTCLI